MCACGCDLLPEMSVKKTLWTNVLSVKPEDVYSKYVIGSSLCEGDHELKFPAGKNIILGEKGKPGSLVSYENIYMPSSVIVVTS